MTSVLPGVYELIVGYQSIGKGRFTAPSRLVHERAAGYPYDSSRGKAARPGTSQELEHMLYCCVWMHNMPNMLPTS
jgi:hypothetical protein